MVAVDNGAGSGSSQSTSQNLDTGTLPDSTVQDHVKVPTTVIIPIVIITVALLIPLYLCLRRLQGTERVTPLYRQDHVVEKPKLCEVALVGNSLGGNVVHHPWRRLRPLSIHQHSSYSEFKDSSSCCDSRSSRSLSPSSRRSSSRYSLGRPDSLDSMSQLRVGVLIAMPSPPQSGRKTPEDAAPIPDLCLGFTDVPYSGKPA